MLLVEKIPTTAGIKYLRSFGFKVNNELFEQHSWYFRNALVRTIYKNHTKNIYATDEFLLRFFGNLLFEENHILKNREIHVLFADTVKEQNDTVKLGIDTANETVFSLIKQNNKIKASEISERLSVSLSTAKREIKKLKEQQIIERIGSDKTGHWEIIKNENALHQ